MVNVKNHQELTELWETVSNYQLKYEVQQENTYKSKELLMLVRKMRISKFHNRLQAVKDAALSSIVRVLELPFWMRLVLCVIWAILLNIIWAKGRRKGAER